MQQRVQRQSNISDHRRRARHGSISITPTKKKKKKGAHLKALAVASRAAFSSGVSSGNFFGSFNKPSPALAGALESSDARPREGGKGKQKWKEQNKEKKGVALPSSGQPPGVTGNRSGQTGYSQSSHLRTFGCKHGQRLGITANYGQAIKTYHWLARRQASRPPPSTETLLSFASWPLVRLPCLLESV